MQQKITYELPLNERVRTLLRLEFLFLQARHTLDGTAALDSRATLAGILDILTVSGRTDLKSEALKELERHAATLGLLDKVAGVDLAALGLILDQLDNLIDRFHAMSGHPRPRSPASPGHSKRSAGADRALYVCLGAGGELGLISN